MAERSLPPVQESSFLGMIANSRAEVPVGYALLAQNFYLDDGTWVARPGMRQIGSAIGGGSKVQGIVQFSELDGSTHVLAFANSDMYELDWGTLTWSQTDLGTEGVVMDPSSTLDFANSRGRLIVTDGVNTPWMLTRSAGAWVFTVLSNAPIARRVTIYYDKVFFTDIPGEENEFEWSDEGDPANGYEANNQVWEFAQTDAGRIRAIAALNELAVILKEDSTSMLMGAVDEEFRTNAVREGVSETEGTIAGGSVVIVDGTVYCLAQNGPRAILGGQRMIALDEVNLPSGVSVDVLEDIWSNVNRDEWDNSVGFADLGRRQVVWLIPTADANLNYALVYTIDRNAWSVFSWDTGFHFTAAEPVESLEGEDFVLLGTDDGRIFQYGRPTDNDDDGTAIEYILRSRLYGRSTPTVVKRLTEVQLMLDVDVVPVHPEMRPNQDGVIGKGKAFGRTTAGRYRYRRGFNATGYGVGWELYLARPGQRVNVEAAMTIMTAVGLYPSW